MPLLKKISFMIVSCIALNACAVSAPVGRAAINSFAHVMPMNLNVAVIEIRDSYVPPMTEPNVEHTMVNPPNVTTANMLKRVFNAVGAEDKLIFDITQAGIIEARQPVNNSPWLTSLEYVYDATLRSDVKLVKDDSVGQEIGSGVIDVKRRLKAPARMSLAEREIALNAMIEKLVMDFHDGFIEIAEDDFQIILD